MAFLRIYADFNSGGSLGDGPCWLLRYGPDRRPLDEVADQLGLRAGMAVILFNAEELGDYAEEFEVDAVLEDHADSRIRWQALPDWSTYRLIRGG